MRSSSMFLVAMILLGGALIAPPSWARGGGHGGQRMVTPPARGHDPDEAQAAQLLANAIAGLGCDQAGEALRRLSNALLGSAQFASQPGPRNPPPAQDRRGRLREEMRNKWKGHLRSGLFWNQVWERLAETYRSCNLTCFDDGVAIGQISGLGYCAASVAVEGLTSPGFTYQPPLPLCQNSIFAGCQQGYRNAARQYEGCNAYTSGAFDSVFREYQSQDCHID